MKIEIIDIHFKHLPHTIAVYLIITSEGPVLIETGPYATYPRLKTEIERKGYRIEEVRHVLLTHIHLDHAGAAWAFAKNGATIYLHPFGAENMADPSRLMRSAKRIYQEEMETLWGDMQAIPAQQLWQTSDKEGLTFGDTAVKALHTPGHAKHHIAWQLDEVIFAGDVGGVKIDHGPVVPPCPPPDIHLEDWRRSIETLSAARPQALYLTHYGKITQVDEHLHALKVILEDWAGWVKAKMEQGMSTEEMTPDFVKYTTAQLRAAGLSSKAMASYEAANPLWMSVAGLVRYWTKQVQK